MKKIGICTLNEACNIGANLQAFCMQETLKNMGYKPEFLRIKKCVVHDEAARSKEFTENIQKLNISKNYYNPDIDQYDAIIVGSDEIWNVLEQSFEHIDEFLGYNLNAPKIIAYAPGANKTNGKVFEEYYKGTRDLNNFTSLSARDTNALDIIRTIAKNDAPIVLDPTFLIDSYEPYTTKCKDKDFILVYGWDFKENEKKVIIDFAKSNNLKLYSIGYELDWCEKFIGSNIFNFMSYMKEATYSITSETFHGIIFSIIFNKQFVTLTHGRFKSRELLERIGLEDRDCMTASEILEKINKKINYNNVNKWLKEEKQKSINYLKQAIEG